MADDKVNILVVDDVPDKLLAMRVILEELDQNLITVTSGREALRKLLHQEFAVILLDVNMPDLDGFETAAMIRQRPKSALTPIIFVTAFSDEMQAARGYSLGAVDYILSPVVPEILRTKVRVFVELFRMNEQVKKQAEERIALAREQAARAAAEETTRRSLFLAEASNILGSSLDNDAIVQSLVRLLVPALGDLAAVTLLGEGGTRATDYAWLDEKRAFRAYRSGADQEPYPALWEAAQRAIAVGKVEMATSLSPRPRPIAAIEPADFPADELSSAVIVPLIAHRRTLGVLAVAIAPKGRRFSLADLSLAEDLAGRAAIALDNARLYRDIKAADRRKDEFLAMLAHELRNPLAPIRNAVHILQTCEPQGEELQLARDVIGRQVQHLVRMVDDLLDVSRITRGKIHLQLKLADVAVVVPRAVETSTPLIESRRQQLTVHLPEEPVRVRADETRLAQVLANLLNNAAKFTPEGGRIALSLESTSAEAVFRVRDTGVGIAPEMLARVFDLFTQADQSLDRSQGGLGIGLTLVRRLVELHGGSVRACSAGANQGSEFVVRLPLAVGGTGSSRDQSDATHDGQAGIASAPAALSKRVLVVDDNRDAANSLSLLLRRAGHDVRTVLEGSAALEVARSFRPQFVILDIGLPDIDGYEVARRLRAQQNRAELMLVALTGFGQDKDRERSLEAGFDRHMVKPVDLEALQVLLTETTTAEVRRA
jgi:signal transduction histidine kinase/DNA-binding response OmpR family regulator